MKKAFREGGVIASEYQYKSKQMDLAKRRMSAQDKELIKNLEEAIGSKETSEEKRIAAVKEMAQVYKRYDYELDL